MAHRVEGVCNKCTQIKGYSDYIPFPDIAVLEPVAFYPIHFNKRINYFEYGAVKFEKTYGHHLWSSLSPGMEAPEKSILAQIAKRFCPTTFELFQDSFGS